MVFCLCILCTGFSTCFGGGSDFSDDLLEKLEKGEITEEDFNKQMQESLTVPLYATKAMYRNTSGLNTDGTGFEDYYAKFALYLTRFLVAEYGFYDINLFSTIEGVDVKDFQIDYPEYAFDSIRYQITGTNQISTLQKADGTQETVNLFAVNYDVNLSWNWTFPQNSSPNSVLETIEGLYPYPDASSQIEIENTSIIKVPLTGFNFSTYSQTYYQYEQRINDYLSTTLTDNKVPFDNIFENMLDKILKSNDDNKRSDLVNAIEYLLYCYSLKIEPAEIVINGLDVTIGGAEPADMVEYIKGVFAQRGTTIGFDDDDKEALTNFILDEVIGEAAQTGQKVVVKTGVTLVEHADGTYTLEGGEVITPDIDVNRDYQNIVSNIVDVAYQHVNIGKIDGDEIHINQRYLNSEFVDFWGNNFFIGSDDDEFEHIPEKEYQSSVMMFSKKFSLDNIWVAVRYGGSNGLKKGYNFNEYIEINVNLNIFLNGEWRCWGTERLKVPAGEFDASECELPAGFAQIAKFEGLEEQYRDEKYKELGFSRENGIVIQPFKPEMDNKILSQGMVNSNGKYVGYGGQVQIGNPIKLVGTTSVKDYYKIVEPKDNLENGKYISSGMFNYEKLTGEILCDYIEITYDVIKTSGDFTKNYSFQTGISLVC